MKLNIPSSPFPFALELDPTPAPARRLLSPAADASAAVVDTIVVLVGGSCCWGPFGCSLQVASPFASRGPPFSPPLLLLQFDVVAAVPPLAGALAAIVITTIASMDFWCWSGFGGGGGARGASGDGELLSGCSSAS